MTDRTVEAGWDASRSAAGTHNPWLVTFVLSMATFMTVLDTSIANVALLNIAGGLGASVDESTWVVTSYLVANAIILPISSWLSDVIGPSGSICCPSGCSRSPPCCAGWRRTLASSWRLARSRASVAAAWRQASRLCWRIPFRRRNARRPSRPTASRSSSRPRSVTSSLTNRRWGASARVRPFHQSGGMGFGSPKCIASIDGRAINRPSLSADRSSASGWMCLTPSRRSASALAGVQKLVGDRRRNLSISL